MSIKNYLIQHVTRKSVLITLLTIIIFTGIYEIWMRCIETKRALVARLAQLEHVVTLGQQNNNVFVAKLNQRLQDIDAALAEQKRVQSTITLQQQGSRAAWVINNTYESLKLAALLVQYRHNIAYALQLLTQAEESLSALNDTRLLTLQRAIANDRQYLQALPVVNTAQLYSRLLTVKGQLGQLPLSLIPTSVPNTTLTDTPQSGWRKGLQATWRALQTIIVVRHNAHDFLPSLLPEQQQFFYFILQAEIEKALLAVLNQQQALYELSLQNVLDWLQTAGLATQPHVLPVLATLKALQHIALVPPSDKPLTSLQVFQDYFKRQASL